MNGLIAMRSLLHVVLVGRSFYDVGVLGTGG